LLLCEWSSTRNRPADERVKKFCDAGVEIKLKILQKEFQIRTVAAPYIRSFNKARNCLTHRMGIVGPRDCTERGGLVVRFVRPEFVLMEDNGNEHVLPVEAGGSFRTESPARRGQIRPQEETRRFTLGARLLLDPLDVKYVFWTLDRCALELKSSTVAKVEEMGFPVKAKKPDNNPSES
jgi:hypothetical protein